MKILIIRHGDPDYANDTLTAQGWEEAELLAKRLAKLPMDDIYLSPMGRAQATAKPTLQALGRTGTTLDWLHEFSGTIINPKSGESCCPWNLLPGYWTRQEELLHPSEWRQNGLYRTGNTAETYDRIAGALDALLETYGYKRNGRMYTCEEGSEKVIVFFCHLGLGMMLLSYLLHLSPTVLWHSFYLPTTSITTLVTEERRPGEVNFRCTSMGDVSHLEGHDGYGFAGVYNETYSKKAVKEAQ